jgi:hypothetical protein
MSQQSPEFGRDTFVAPVVSTWPKHQQGPLGARGWALQEEVISPRVLQFTAIHLFWRCIESQHDDEFPDIDLQDPFAPREVTQISDCYLNAVGSPHIPDDQVQHPNHEHVLRYWCAHVVDEYIVRQLTYKMDILVSILGIVKELRPHISND